MPAPSPALPGVALGVSAPLPGGHGWCPVTAGAVWASSAPLLHGGMSSAGKQTKQRCLSEALWKCFSVAQTDPELIGVMKEQRPTVCPWTRNCIHFLMCSKMLKKGQFHIVCHECFSQCRRSPEMFYTSALGIITTCFV